jgi:hypothetical protein
MLATKSLRPLLILSLFLLSLLIADCVFSQTAILGGRRSDSQVTAKWKILPPSLTAISTVGIKLASFGSAARPRVSRLPRSGCNHSGYQRCPQIRNDQADQVVPS